MLTTAENERDTISLVDYESLCEEITIYAKTVKKTLSWWGLNTEWVDPEWVLVVVLVVLVVVLVVLAVVSC